MEHFIVQFYENTDKESVEVFKKTLRYFMVEDKQLCLYYYIVENTIFIYTIDKKNWNMSKLSIMIRGIMKGSDFLFYKAENYDGLMGKEFWSKKKDAMIYFKDKRKFLEKYQRSMKIEKFISDMEKDKDEDDLVK